MNFSLFKNVNSVFFLAVSLLYITASCTKKVDLEGEGEPEIENPGIIASGDFDWSTSRTITVQVPVGDEFEGGYFYKLELFDKEPHLEGAKLLGAGLAKKGQDLVTKVTIPSNLTSIFVQKTSPLGEVSYSILDIASSTQFVGAKLASVRGAKLASTTPVSSVPPTVPTVPAGALELSGSDNVTAIPSSKAFVVKKGEWFSGNIPSLENGSTDGLVVYVYGKWHHTKDVNLGKNSRVVIMPGGEFNVATLNLNSGTASFDSHGDVLLKSMKIGANNSFKNVGTLRIDGLVAMVGAAEFVNYQSDVKVKVSSLTMVDASSVVTNNGEIEILDGSFKNGTLNANCYTTVGKMLTSNATVNIWGEAMLDVTNLDSEGGEFNLYTKSVLDVTKIATFNSNAKNEPVRVNTVGATWDKKSYVRIKYVRVGASKKVHLAYNGFMSVITDEHPKYADGTFIVSGTGVEVHWDLYNHPPYISATSCNAGGAGTKPTTPPTDQKLTEVKLGAHTYLFEDNWPNMGDYDLNDLVLSVDVTKYQNTSNQVEKIVLVNTISASGAKRAVAAAIQFDNVLAGAIKSVTYSSNTKHGTRIPLNGVGIEAGQAKAVVSVADFVHEAFGLTGAEFIFTTSTDAYKPMVTTITIEFNSPIANFSFDDLNPFIINPYGVQPYGAPANGKRYEVHLVGHQGTDKLDAAVVLRAQGKSMLATDDASIIVLDANDPFKTGDVKSSTGESLKGWPFAISVPVGDFKYQRNEGSHIRSVYPKFVEWATSGGALEKDWYTKPVK